MDVKITQKTEEEVVTKHYFIIGRMKIAASTLIEILEGLDSHHAIEIYDPNIGDLLVELDVADRQGPSSYYEGKNIDEFYDIVHDKLFKEE